MLCSYTTRYYRRSRLLGELALARADGSYPRIVDRLQKTELLVLNDYGLNSLTDPERRDLLEVLEDRHGRQATLVTSQLPLEHWHEVVGDAILDRLVHHAHTLSLKGSSMRRKTPGKEDAAPRQQA
ncbi:MAG: ATP-binding protein [Gemmatimonadota bacterium]